MRSLKPRRQGKHFVLERHVVATYDEDGVTLFDPKRGKYWRGNSGSVTIIEMLSVGDTVQNIVQALHASSPSVSGETVESDVQHLLDLLQRGGLVARSEE